MYVCVYVCIIKVNIKINNRQFYVWVVCIFIHNNLYYMRLCDNRLYIAVFLFACIHIFMLRRGSLKWLLSCTASLNEESCYSNRIECHYICVLLIHEYQNIPSRQSNMNSPELECIKPFEEGPFGILFCSSYYYYK